MEMNSDSTSVIENLKLQFALKASDTAHAAIHSSLENGIPDATQYLALVNSYGALIAYAGDVAKKLKKEGCVLSADHPALHQKDAVLKASEDFAHEIIPYMQGFFKEANHSTAQARQGQPWAGHVLAVRSSLPSLR